MPTQFYPMTHDDALALIAALNSFAPGLVTTTQRGFLAPDESIEDGFIKDADETTHGLMTPAFVKMLNCLSNHSVYAAIPRWLRFDSTNKKGLIIKAGTHILKANGEIAHYTTDTQVDLSGDISANGTDYGVYLLNDGTIKAATTAPSGSVKIGRFHTLCANAGSMNMTAPAAPSSGLSSGSKYLVKGYREDTDPDFYAFYNKTISAVTVQTQYDVITCPHPLSGFSAGDILPESVFCLSFHPETLYEDAMVYDVDTGRCIDIYLQSGSGHSTRSAYNGTHRVSKSPWNHQEDMRMVGKRLLRDCEFTSAAIGSNERTNITGSSDKTYVGGHVDTNNRRMISAIGCEEMCGYLWQWLDEIAPVGNNTSGWQTGQDGHDSFGQGYGDPYVLLAGGLWGDGAFCGSRSRYANLVRSVVDLDSGGRGSSRVYRFA